MVTRRRFGALAVLSAIGATATATASGCGGPPDDGKVHITFRYLWTGSEGAALERIIAAFNRSQRRVVVHGNSNPDQQSQLAAMSSGHGSFDISDGFSGDVGTWASRGVLEPLDHFIARDRYDLADFIPSTLPPARYRKTTYALPLCAHSSLLIYNPKLLRKAGIARPPRTMSEFARDIRKLTIERNGRIEQLGFGSQTGAGTDFTTLGWAFGGRWYDANGKPTPADPHNIQALQFYVDTISKPYGVRELDRFVSGFGDYQSAQNPFYQGKLAMTTDGEVISRFTKEFAPKLPWNVAPIPYPDGRPDLARTTGIATSTIFIPRNSPNKDAAWEFMKFLLSRKAMGDFTYALGNLPTRSSLVNDKRYDDLPHFRVFAEAMTSPNARSMPSSITLVDYQADLGNAFDQAIRLTKPPRAALEDVAKRAESYDDFR